MPIARAKRRRRSDGSGARSLHVIPTLMLTGFIAVLSISPCRRAVCGEKRSGPNVVLILTDDLGWKDTGFAGNRVVKTPHLDAMARGGLRFTRFYSASAVCSPTRGSCLTGRHPHRYGIFSANVGHMPPEEWTLAELLRDAGYTTGHFGKWHLGTLTKTVVESNRGGPRGAKHFSPPWENGFEVCFSTEAKTPTWDPMLRPKGVGRNTWWDPVEKLTEATAYGTHYWTESGMGEENLRGDDSRVIMDRAIPFIRSAAERGKPFLAVVWFHAPHLPVVAGEKYTSLYEEHGDYARHYFGCITAMDEQVGRLRAVLRELRVAENTLVAFCSDNGPEGKAGSAPGSAGILRGRKRDLFEGGIRVPGLIEWPARIQPGSQTDLPAFTSDYVPTILDILDLSLPEQRPLDGVSLLPLFEGKLKDRPQPMGFWYGRQAAWIDNRYKLYTRHAGRKKQAKKDASAATTTYQLFNLQADPAEKHDLSQEMPDLARRMKAELERWRSSCRASLAGEDYDR